MHNNTVLLLIDECVGLAKGNPPPRLVWPVRLLHHSYAVDDRAHAHTQGAPRAVGGHVREVRLGVKSDGLVA